MSPTGYGGYQQNNPPGKITITINHNNNNNEE